MLTADYTFDNHGSLWLVTPASEAAADHLREHVSQEALWWGSALVVEPRYVVSLAESLEADGFSTAL